MKIGFGQDQRSKKGPATRYKPGAKHDAALRIDDDLPRKSGIMMIVCGDIFGQLYRRQKKSGGIALCSSHSVIRGTSAPTRRWEDCRTQKLCIRRMGRKFLAVNTKLKRCIPISSAVSCSSSFPIAFSADPSFRIKKSVLRCSIA